MRIKPLSQFLLACFLVGLAACATGDALQIILEMDAVKSQASSEALLMYEKATFYFITDKTVFQFMRPDLSSELVVLAVNPPNDWGINCRNESLPNNGCNYTEAPSTVTYLDKSYKAYPMNLASPFKTDNTYNLDGKYLQANGLYDKEESGKDVFVLNSTGVMGMAPNSGYFKNLYTHKAFPNNWFVFSFEYVLDRQYDFWFSPRDPKAYKNGTISLNGYNQNELLSNSKLFNKTVPRSSRFWQVDDVQLEVGNLTKGGLTLCITNRENAFFAADPSFELKKLINQAICKSDKGCALDSNTALAPSINLIMSTFKLQITPKDYTFPNSSTNAVDQLVDDISVWRNAGSCSPSANIAVGRMFFSKYALIFHFSTDETRDHILSFGIRKESRPLTKEEKAILVGLGLGMIGLVLVVMVVKSVMAARSGVKETQLPSTDHYVSVAANRE